VGRFEDRTMIQYSLEAVHPATIVQDRYGGCYSGGPWLAISRADKMHCGRKRADWVLAAGPSGDDREAAAFWQSPPDWIAVGDTSDAALVNLLSEARALRD